MFVHHCGQETANLWCFCSNVQYAADCKRTVVWCQCSVVDRYDDWLCIVNIVN